ncbi:(E3-independent) E2 ubiquitin-conjugating enzyme [Ranunculus cassubicifolius]
MATSSSPFHPNFRVLISLQLLLLFNHFISSSAYVVTPPSSISKVSYTKFCNSIVPEATSNYIARSKSNFPQLNSGYFNGGDTILGQNLTFSPKSFNFRLGIIHSTDMIDVMRIEGMMVFRAGNKANIQRSNVNPSRFRTRLPRIPLRRNRVNFRLNGFWSESSGKLCMVGTGTGYSKQGNLLELSAVFKLNYPKNSTILTSLVSGSVESVDNVDSSNYFEPISVLAYSQRNYEYTLLSGFSEIEGLRNDSALSLQGGKSICSQLGSFGGYVSSSVYELEYGGDCNVTTNCSPIGGLPGSMFFSEVQCSDDGRFRLMIGFPNTSFTVYNRYSQPLGRERMLVGEGVWDGSNNRLHVVACRVTNSAGSLSSDSIGDCSVRLSMLFPAVMSIKSRSGLLGQLWSNKTTNETGYFDRIVFQSPMNRISAVPGLKYGYTEIDRALKSCPKKSTTKGVRYPSGYSYDMRFNMRVSGNRGLRAWGYATPLSMGEEFFGNSRGHLDINSLNSLSNNTSVSRILNISYSINLTPNYQGANRISSPSVTLDLSAPVEISAEGVYNSETGQLCMVGCRYVKSLKNHSMDCEIVINVQFRSLDSKASEYVKGNIQSTRTKKDPLYFEKIEFASISLSGRQAAASLLRMDLEITMVLISNTLICVFVGLQIFYVKKHPDVLPSISLVMLTILTLGQMIPLVLNFEALFLTNRNRQNIMESSGGWLEVNEVLVRVVTMVSFLLQFRLLQISWSPRFSDENKKGLMTAEKKAFYVLFPLYLVGAFIAWGIHWKNTSHEAVWRHGISPYYQRISHSIWLDLRSYAGLLLDGFLLPQILFNAFWSSKDKSLHPAFYVGITSVHLIPHAYDLYRAHNYAQYYGESFIYASPGGDFFSTAWDLIIPCGGLLFAILIFLQQRFGGGCIIPSRFRQTEEYEKVPVEMVQAGEWTER